MNKLIPIELVTFLLTIVAIIGITYVVYRLPVTTEVRTAASARCVANKCTGDVSIETVFEGTKPVLWRVRCVKRP